MTRWGVYAPFEQFSLSEWNAWVDELATLGYDDLWTAELNAADGFTPLALAAARETPLRLGVGIASSFTRGPAMLAMSVAALCRAAPGRFVMGLGSSSDVIVQGWNGIPFGKPYSRTRDVAHFLRAALAGEHVSQKYDTFSVDGFRLELRVEEPPPILIAALRSRMLGLAGSAGDGAILTYLAADNLPKVIPLVKRGGENKEIVASLSIGLGEDRERLRHLARRQICAYVNVPVYAAYQKWLGRGPLFEEMWRRWAAGDRKGALAAVPDEAVDDLSILGNAEECRAQLQRYIDGGIDTFTLMALEGDVRSSRELAKVLAPAAGS